MFPIPANWSGSPRLVMAGAVSSRSRRAPCLSGRHYGRAGPGIWTRLIDEAVARVGCSLVDRRRLHHSGSGWIGLAGEHGSLRGDQYFHVSQSYLWLHPRFLALAPLAVAGLIWARRHAIVPNRSFYLLVLVVALLPLVTSLFTESWCYIACPHFSVTFDPIVRVHSGRSLLVDSTSQYGLYAWFLEPIFWLIGLSVLKFTIVMGLLSTGSYCMIAFFLKRTGIHPILALLGTVATLFNGWMFYVIIAMNNPDGLIDHYFQYVPIRLLFPASLLGLAVLYWTKPSRGLYGIIWLVVGVALLWNLDSGLPAAAAWLATLVYLEGNIAGWKARFARGLGHIFAAGASCAFVLAFYGLTTRWRSGAWPDFTLLGRSQRIFYGTGFGMLPMPWPGAWMLVVAVYLIGLTHAALEWARGVPSVRARAIFLNSFLGILLFSYLPGSQPSVRSAFSMVARLSFAGTSLGRHSRIDASV